MRPRYTWEVTAHLDEVAPAIMPRWLLTLVTAPGRSTLPRGGTPLLLREGERNRRLFQLGAALRRCGIGAEALCGALEAVNRAHCVPPLEVDEVAKIAGSAARYAPSARCTACGAPLPEEHRRGGDGRDEDALVARALGVL
jgi:Primase C terminal 1 (PriCT-1)